MGCSFFSDCNKCLAKKECPIKAENKILLNIVREADEYLDSLYAINEISSNSILHKKFKEAIKKVKEG